MSPSDRRQWVAIEDDFCQHPKILKVGAAGGWAHIRAITYAAHYRTDGFIPKEAVWQIMHDDPIMDAEANDGLEASMVEAGLWHPVANGYQIHDYLQHQSNAETIREKRARAGRLGGLASGKQRRSKQPASKLDVDLDVDIEPKAVMDPKDEGPPPEEPQWPNPDDTAHGLGSTHTPRTPQLRRMPV